MSWVTYNRRLGIVIGVYYPDARPGGKAGRPERVFVGHPRNDYEASIFMTRGGPKSCEERWV